MIHAAESAAVLLFPLFMILGAVLDLVSYRIPNWVSGALVAAFLGAAASVVAAGAPLSVVGVDIAVGIAALLAGVAMFALGWIGGGDAKLFAAAALWLGWPALPTFLPATTLACGAVALLLVALRSEVVRPLARGRPSWFARLAEPGESVPYGVAIAAGALAAFPASDFARAVFRP